VTPRLCIEPGCDEALRPGQPKFCCRKHADRNRQREHRRRIAELRTFHEVIVNEEVAALLAPVVDLADCRQRLADITREREIAECFFDDVRRRRHWARRKRPIYPSDEGSGINIKPHVVAEAQKAKVRAALANRKQALITEGQRIVERLAFRIDDDQEKTMTCAQCQRFTTDCQALGGHKAAVLAEDSITVAILDDSVAVAERDETLITT
jgi:hypothetical protein